MVRFVYTNYTGVNKLHFEPVDNLNDNDAEFYNDFVDAFMTAKK